MVVPVVAWLSLLAAAPEVSLFLQGPRSDSCSGAELPLLHDKTRLPVDVEIRLHESGLGIFQHGRDIVLSTQAFSDPLEVVKAIETGTLELLTDNLPLALSDQGLSFQWPREGLPDVLGAMQSKLGPSFTLPDWETELRFTQGRLFRLRTAGREALVVRLPGEGEPTFNRQPLHYQPTFGVSSLIKRGNQNGNLFWICRSVGEHGRVKRALDEARAGVLSDSHLMLSAGDAFTSVMSGERFRIQLDDLVAQRFDAMAPGARELELGAEKFLSDDAARLPMTAANLTYNEGPRAGELLFPAYRIFRRAGKSIVVVGMVPSALAQQLHPKILGNVVIGDPKKAFAQAIHQASAQLGGRPDLIVLLTLLEGTDAGLWTHEISADVVAGHFEGPTSGSFAQEAFVPSRPWRRTPLVLAPATRLGFSQIGVDFGEDARGVYVQSVKVSVVRVSHSDQEPDTSLDTRRAKLFLDEAKRQVDIVLPPAHQVIGGDAGLEALSTWDDDSTRPSFKWTGQLIRQLAAHLTLEAANAEVAAVRPFYLVINSGGSMSAFVVGRMNQERDRVAVTYLSGAELKQLGVAAMGADPPLLFAKLDVSQGKVDGRSIDLKAWYRVALPDSLWTDPVYAPILQSHTFELGDRIGDLLVGRLRALRDRSGGLNDDYAKALRQRLHIQGAPSVLWTFTAEQVGVTYLLSKAVDTRPYSLIREQRLQSPSFQLLQLRGVVSATRDSESLTWRSQLNVRFQRLFFGNLDNGIPFGQRELEDTILPESQLRLKWLKIDFGSNSAIELIPFLAASYETEFTAQPATQTTPAIAPKAYLRGSSGLGIFPGNWVEELRVGGVVQKDFRKKAGLSLQVGMNAGMKLSRALGPLTARWESNVTWFPGSTGIEPLDLDVLSFKAQSTFSFMMPISHWLQMGVTADWLAVRGSVPSTAHFGHSFQMGLTLAIDRTWKPAFESL